MKKIRVRDFEGYGVERFMNSPDKDTTCPFDTEW